MRALFRPKEPYGFRQELDGTNLSAVKLERILSRRWSNRYTVEMQSNRLTVCTPGLLSERDIASCYR
ncbi:hypothetical protein FLAG1_10011 [Fusarium langsethiae]|uniref:Uncharacterized protein n=1 Tax=Fusarium langsethiae TaxID=179993 RepID=A0A0M9EPW4_FUSLA|nr:hypothetical protein FLAG1_10011 [Fusarium langsethiae]